MFELLDIARQILSASLADAQSLLSELQDAEVSGGAAT